MKFLCTFLAVFYFFTAVSQTVSNLSGIVMDEKRKGLENVNVLLLNTADSSLLTATVTDKQGKYEVKPAGKGNYLLLFSKVGFANKYQSVLISEEGDNKTKTDTIILTIEVKALKEVIISSRKPFIEQKLDRMIVNIENSIISAGNNGLEVLEKLPGVRVDPNGTISLKGKAVQIHIDGRPANMSGEDLANLLRGLTANQVEKIEIISNPSSRYDAAGSGGIINIVMKRDQKVGLNGTITLGYNQGVYPKFNQGITFNYRNKKLNLYGSYNASERKSVVYANSDRKFKSGTVLLSNFVQEGKSIDNTWSHNLRTGIDFFIHKRTTLGFLFTGAKNHFKSVSNSLTQMKNGTGVIDSMLHAFSNNSSKWTSYTLNTNFRHRFDSAGKELTIDLDYSNYERNYEQFFRNAPLSANGNPSRSADTLSGTLPAILMIFTFKADYIHPLKENKKIEAGIKSSSITNDNDLTLYNRNGHGPVLNTSLSNHFIYKENINAFYVNFSHELEKWSYQVGIRGEQTVAKGNQLTTNQKFTRDYFQLFPTAFLNYTPTEKHQVGLSYSRRVGRPAYNIVNPFRIFRDPYTYSEGNPLIRPETGNNFELNYVFNNMVIVGLGYGKTANSMTFVVNQDDSTKTTVETYDNLATLEDGSITVSVNFKIAPWWMANNFVGAFYNHFRGNYNNGTVDNSGVIFNASINHSIILSKNYTLEFGGFYLSDQPQGIITISPQANFTFGIQRSFAQKRGTLRVSMSDVFKTQQWEKRTLFSNIDARFKNTWDSRQFRLTLNWKFGKQTVTGERRRKSASEEEKSRIQMEGSRG